jgi:hypothetical protein
VEEAKKLKEKDYTKESFKVLDQAVKNAEKVLKDKKATQADIDKALAELNGAVDALEANAPAPKPGEGEKPGTETKPGDEEKPETETEPAKDEKPADKKPDNNKAPTTSEVVLKVAKIVGAIAKVFFGWMFS